MSQAISAPQLMNMPGGQTNAAGGTTPQLGGSMPQLGGSTRAIVDLTQPWGGQTNAAGELTQPQGGPTKVSGELAQKLDQLEGACKDFESVFTAKLLEVMRQTVPQDKLINGGRAEEIFTGMLDEETAKMIAKGNTLGVAKMMFQQMKQQLLQGTKGSTDPKMLELGKELLKSQLKSGKTGDQQNNQMTAPAQIPTPGNSTPANSQLKDAAELLLKNDATGGAGQGQLVRNTPSGLSQDMNLTAILQQWLDQNKGATASPNGPAGQQLTTSDPTPPPPTVNQTAVNSTKLPNQQELLNIMAALDKKSGTQTLENKRDTAVSTIKPDGPDEAAGSLRQKIESVTAETAGANQAQQTAQDQLVQELSAQNQLTQNPATQDNAASLLSTSEGQKQDLVGKYRRTHVGDDRANFSRRVSQNLAADQPTDESAQTKGSIVNLAERRLAMGRNNAALDGTSGSGGPQSSKSQGTGATAMPLMTTLTDDLNNRLKQAAALDQAKIADSAKNIMEPDKLIDQIVKKAELSLKNGLTEMKIELEPKQLGEIKISVVMQDDMVTAKIFAKSDAVGDVIRTNLGQLGDSLKDLGYNVGSFDVSSGGDYNTPGRSDQSANPQNGQGSFAGLVNEPENETSSWTEPPLLMYQARGIYSFDVVA